MHFIIGVTPQRQDVQSASTSASASANEETLCASPGTARETGQINPEETRKRGQF